MLSAPCNAIVNFVNLTVKKVAGPVCPRLSQSLPRVGA